jgi:hypothetical protein
MASSDYIWCPQKIGETVESFGIVPAGALPYHYSFGPMTRYNLFIFASNSIQSLIPRYALPFPLASPARTLERILETVRVINKLKVS